MSLKKLLAGIPGFLSREDIQAASELQGAFDIFKEQERQYHGTPHDSAYQAAKEQYRQSPTSENLEKAEIAFSKRRRAGRFQVDAKNLIAESFKTFRLESVLRWVFPIWLRAFDLAKANAEKVTQEESDRIFALTGKHVTHSDVIAAANQTVESLQDVGDGCLFTPKERARTSGGMLVGSAPSVSAAYEGRSPTDWMAYFGFTLTGETLA